ncbi:RNA-binding protein 1-like [Silene latifolia]|uniref:RNA-binding protein 1-like n=1 Tax=Silene latifolia TaxID=37657 RepID=UPI003D78A607
MSDPYYAYQNTMQPPQAAATLVGKRPRNEYDVPPPGQEPSSYYSHEDNRAPQRQMRETEPINHSYNHYLPSGQNPYLGAETGTLHSSGYPANDPRMGIDPRFGNDPRMVNDPRIAVDHRIASDPRMGGVMDPGMSLNGRGSNLGSGRSEVPLPPDASSTIFVEGLPSNCSRREVAHIFRPFVGYKEVRLVTKESRRPGGDPLVLCFVDFLSPPHAATALNALHGYLFDETDRDSAILRLQYARFPGARSSGGGRRSKR